MKSKLITIYFYLSVLFIFEFGIVLLLQLVKLLTLFLRNIGIRTYDNWHEILLPILFVVFTWGLLVLCKPAIHNSNTLKRLIGLVNLFLIWFLTLIIPDLVSRTEAEARLYQRIEDVGFGADDNMISKQDASSYVEIINNYGKAEIAFLEKREELGVRYSDSERYSSFVAILIFGLPISLFLYGIVLLVVLKEDELTNPDTIETIYS